MPLSKSRRWGGNFVDGMSRKVDFLVVEDERHTLWMAGDPTGKIKELLEPREQNAAAAEVLSERDFLAVLFGG
ncbi:unannotated protein [freshwater metagenome]|uniref:Unannotated protein n=1 Tax=freshwater metagenome TaxID=449393 RepID=A0A6J7QHU2_9ZZZZ